MPVGFNWSKGFEWDTDDVIYDAWLNTLNARMHGNGVLKGVLNELRVHANSPADMTVIIEAGECLLADGTKLTLSSASQLAVSAPSNYDRIDLVIINATNPSGAILQGTESTTPKPPDVPENTVVLATYRVSPTTTAIEDTAIRDLRMFMSDVTSERIQDNAVTSAKIADNSISSAKIQDGAVSASKIADGSISTAKIVDGAITNAKLADSSVSSAKLQDGIVTEAKLADSSVSNAKLQDNAVTSAKIADSSVTGSKIASGVITDTHVSSSAGIAESKLSFDATAGHNHDGTNSRKISHSDLLDVGENDHHPRQHALNSSLDHTGTLDLSQMPQIDSGALYVGQGTGYAPQAKTITGDLTIHPDGRGSVLKFEPFPVLFNSAPKITADAVCTSSCFAGTKRIDTATQTTISTYHKYLLNYLTPETAGGVDKKYKVSIDVQVWKYENSADNPVHKVTITLTTGANVYTQEITSYTSGDHLEVIFDPIALSNGEFKIELEAYAEGTINANGDPMEVKTEAQIHSVIIQAYV